MIKHLFLKKLKQKFEADFLDYYKLEDGEENSRYQRLFCNPKWYGKGVKVLGSGMEGIVILFQLKDKSKIVLKGTMIRGGDVMMGVELSKKNQQKAYSIWKNLAKKSDQVVMPYRQEFCYDKILKPACLGLVAMEFAGPSIASYVVKSKKLPMRWWGNLNKEIMKFLKFLKDNNATHGDFNIRNILLVDTKKPKIKVVDFSFAENEYHENVDLLHIKRNFVPGEYTVEWLKPFLNKVPESIKKFWEKQINEG